MNHLLSEIIEAHGGMHRWRQFNKIEAAIVSGGQLFDLKGFPQDATPRHMTVWLHEQKASMHPFGAADRRTHFTSCRIAIETMEGTVLSERRGHPAEIQEHMKAEQWDALDRAYFNGYALWLYLTTPFFMTYPGFEVQEIEPLHEKGETWRGLGITFPSHIATHSTIQNFYFGEDHFIRRHDYQVEMAGNMAAAQYLYDLEEVAGIWLPTKRRAYKKDANGQPSIADLLVSIDLSDFRFS